MPNYDWRRYADLPWRDRFPEGVRGISTWRQVRLVENVAFRLMEEREETTARLPRPCLFVSHRQADVNQALRIAYLACQEGFDYWLDVLDPALSGLLGSSVAGTGNPQQSAMAIASIIEMGLLNSTHVMAVITPNTKGSQWIPYEYGRVKDPVPISPHAACWVDRLPAPSSVPEYLYLGTITRSESEIKTWLKAEVNAFKPGGVVVPCSWTDRVPGPI